MLLFARFSAVVFALTWLVSGIVLADSPHLQIKYKHVADVGQPVQVTNAADGSGRLFVVSLTGQVNMVQPETGERRQFLEIGGRVATGGERGLFSIAFPPGYASKRYFYACYCRSSDKAVVVSRFHVPAATPDLANAASEQVILAIPHANDYHLGGQIAFGPDGYLYWSVGDGGPQGDPSNNSQNKNLLLGKLLRINPESAQTPYAIPPGNPFVGIAGNRPEIFATGLRNPWRFSFDRQTGDLFLADVGQYAREELNIIPAGSAGGQNFGWRIMEGNSPYEVPPGYNTSTLTPPAFDYDRFTGTSITGGFVYRGPSSALAGLYIFADFGARTLMIAERQGNNWVPRIQEHVHYRFCGFGEGEDGRLFAADHSGTVFELSEDPQVRLPTLGPSVTAFQNAANIVANCTTPGAVIRYTTDGEDPTVDSPVFPGWGLTVDGYTRLRIKAFHDSLLPSETVERVYSFSIATPYFATINGPIYPETGKTVYIRTDTENVTIRYTTDGSTPNDSSPLFSHSVLLPTGPATLKAIVSKPGYSTSEVISASWDKPTLPTPVLAQLNAVSITGTGKIHYTLDGSEPTELSPLFTGQFPITQPVLLRARAFGNGYYPSAQASANLYLVHTESGGTAGGSGTSNVPGFTDSPLFYEAQYRSPEGICMNGISGYYVADTGNHAIRHSAIVGAVGTLAGNGTPGFVNAAGSAARFNSPRGICRDAAGNLYVTDDGNHVIRKIDTGGNVTTYAGNGDTGTANGPALQSSFLGIQGIAMDSYGNLFVGSIGIIRKIDSSGTVSDFATLPNAGRVSLTITGDGRMFATDSSDKVYEIDAAGIPTVFAGGITGYSDGHRSVARFQTLRALSCDSFGALYLCDGDMIRQIQPNGAVFTKYKYQAGNGQSNLSGPRGLVVASNGHVWIADTGYHRIRRSVSNDWDRDGIPDDQEGGTTPFVVGVNDRQADSDGDGQSNSLEYAAGTDPHSGSSRFEMVMQEVPENDQVNLTWQSRQSKRYQIEYTSDFKTWTTFGVNYLGNGGLMSVPVPKGQGQRFYRIGTR